MRSPDHQALHYAVYYCPFRFGYFPQHPIIRHSWTILFAYYERPSVMFIHNESTIYMYIFMLVFMFWNSEWDDKRFGTRCKQIRPLRDLAVMNLSWYVMAYPGILTAQIVSVICGQYLKLERCCHIFSSQCQRMCCMCVCVHARVCARACVCTRVRVCVCVWVCVQKSFGHRILKTYKLSQLLEIN
jgi:hypothetical protein